MDSKKTDNKSISSQGSSYNPFNIFFNPRKRTESETSVASNQSYQSGSQYSPLQRQSSKTNEEYLWIIQRIHSIFGKKNGFRRVKTTFVTND